MLGILGILLVFGAVIGGFLMEKGNPFVLLQPAEVLIVLGAAVGILLASNPAPAIYRMIRGAARSFRSSVHTRESVLRNLRMLYEVFAFTKRAGVNVLEEEIDHPERSSIFSNYPEFLNDSGCRAFVCDSLRMIVIGMTTPHELDQLMDLDIDVQRRSRQEMAAALSTVADSLPGLGIVAAVLGVVITMQAIGGSPELVGQKVAAALVGTFLGILLCYGVVGPLASRVESHNDGDAHLLQMLRTAVVAFARGASPMLALEYGRRSVPLELRPSFQDMESIIRREARVPSAAKPPDAEGESGADTAA
jgi:chemotaxis protein MotA